MKKITNKFDFDLSPLEFVKKYKHIACPYCKEINYKFVGDIKKLTGNRVIMPKDFIGVNKYKNPIKGQKLECQNCKKIMIFEGSP